MNNKIKIHLISLALIALILLAGNVISSSSEQRILVYVSSFGFLALLLLIFVLTIPLLAKLKRNNLTIYLLKNIKWIGIYTFVFALIHVFLASNFLFDWDFAEIAENPYRILGIISFLILALMTLTSNKFSIHLLGKNWKRIQNLIYIALILVIIHSFNIGAIVMKNTAVKIIILILAVLLIAKKVRYWKFSK
jgi:sulfoxide reductase heme-binding subunit YedZ